MASVIAKGIGVSKESEVVQVAESDDEASIDEEQLAEYGDMVSELGSFPDKVAINSLSMVAEDYATSKASAKAVYNVIRDRLLHTSKENMLPLVYVLDSILKNVKGHYIDIAEKDANNWIPFVHANLHEENRAKFKKVWRTWGEFKIFSPESLKLMGRCFEEKTSASATGQTSTEIAGLRRTKDGALVIPASLRREMQNILDDLQSQIENELEKVSLERLADINPDLLATIKQAAQDSLRSGDSYQTSANDGETQDLPPFFSETRSQESRNLSKAWAVLTWNHLEQTDDVIKKLQHHIIEETRPEKRYTQQEAIDMVNYLVAASVTSSILTTALERMKNQDDRTDHRRVSFPGADVSLSANHTSRVGGLAVDKNDFTIDGVKKKNIAVIGLLYEIGLPFVSSSDGKRFATQVELSNHLDALFKKNQLEKTIARTEERGWYVVDKVWTKEITEQDFLAPLQIQGAKGSDKVFEVTKNTMFADESRSTCSICGINFKMFFDSEDGVYKYENCREIEVLNDDIAENESDLVFVHVTCWQGLGSPEILTADLTLQEANL